MKDDDEWVEIEEYIPAIPATNGSAFFNYVRWS